MCVLTVRSCVSECKAIGTLSATECGIFSSLTAARCTGGGSAHSSAAQSKCRVHASQVIVTLTVDHPPSSIIHHPCLIPLPYQPNVIEQRTEGSGPNIHNNDKHRSQEERERERGKGMKTSLLSSSISIAIITCHALHSNGHHHHHHHHHCIALPCAA